MNFPQKLRAARESARLSQDDVAVFVGLTKSRISRWENGEGEPTISQAIRLAKGLGVSVDYLADDGRTAPPEPLNAAEKQALKMIRAMDLDEDDVIKRLSRDPKAPPRIEVEGDPSGPMRSRRA